MDEEEEEAGWSEGQEEEGEWREGRGDCKAEREEATKEARAGNEATYIPECDKTGEKKIFTNCSRSTYSPGIISKCSLIYSIFIEFKLFIRSILFGSSLNKF